MREEVPNIEEGGADLLAHLVIGEDGTDDSLLEGNSAWRAKNERLAAAARRRKEVADLSFNHQALLQELIHPAAYGALSPLGKSLYAKPSAIGAIDEIACYRRNGTRCTGVLCYAGPLSATSPYFGRC